ncbi:efflux transporter periplasmic adaptor subunit, partial [Thauera sinica]
TANGGAPQAGAPERGPRAGGRPPRHGTVKVARDDGALEERTVELGVTNRVQAEIRSGLAEGERVVSGLVTAGAAAAGAPRMTPRL